MNDPMEVRWQISSIASDMTSLKSFIASEFKILFKAIIKRVLSIGEEKENAYVYYTHL